MQQVMLFENEEFGQVRTVMIDGEPYFVGKDVAEILGYAEPRSAISKKVDDEDRGVAKMETPSGMQEMTIINESGLYSLILSSKLESAKKFKRWVTSEVLPSIRQTGSYTKEVNQCNIKEIVKETIYQVVPEIIRELEDKEERNKRAEREMKKLEAKVKRRIERLLYSEKYSYYEISKLLGQEEIDVSAEAICFYAQNIGL